MRAWCCVLATVALLCGDLIAGDDHQAGPEVALQTTYQTTPLLGAHVMRIRGRLGGKGTVAFDPNPCQLNHFGDPTLCTGMAVHEVPVELRRADVQDPSGLGRSVYLLHGDTPEHRPLVLVVGRDRGSPPRLIVGRGNESRVVLALEPMPQPWYAPRAVPCHGATYTAWQTGTSVSVKAEGDHGEFGWRVWFTRLPDEQGIARFRLDCQRPEGAAGQAVTPFSVTTNFTSDEVVDHVTVVDARGPQRVPVTRATPK